MTTAEIIASMIHQRIMPTKDTSDKLGREIAAELERRSHDKKE